MAHTRCPCHAVAWEPFDLTPALGPSSPDLQSLTGDPGLGTYA
jgi:hypothetical protein